MNWETHLNVAFRAADAAEDIIKHYYQKQIEIEIKADYSPVTVADVESERAIKQVILDAYPDHGFYGEETGQENMGSEFVWLIDPIDGTKSFVRHYPFFSTQIALMHRGEIVVGVSNAPMFAERAWASVDNGAYLNSEVINVSQIDRLEDAAISTGNIKTMAQSTRWLGLSKIMASAGRTRGYGDFLHYHMLAAGKIDGVIESDVNILDVAALSVIIGEAGGVITDLDGQAIGLDVTSILSGNPLIYAQLAQVMIS